MHIFKHISSIFKRLHFGARIDPVRDWLALLTLSAITLIGIVVWNVWAFETVASGGTIGTATKEEPEVFDRASLEEVRVIFANRASEEAKYETGVYSFVDPSQQKQK